MPPTSGKVVAVADADKLRKYLFEEFLNSPGVYEKLKKQLHYIKSLPDPEHDDVAPDNSGVYVNMSSINPEQSEITYDNDSAFLPISESSRISDSSVSHCGQVTPQTNVPDLDLTGVQEDTNENERLIRVPVIKQIKSEVISSPNLDYGKLPPHSPRLSSDNVPSYASEERENNFIVDNNIDLVPERNFPSPRAESSTKVPVIQFSNQERSRTPKSNIIQKLLEDSHLSPRTCHFGSRSLEFQSPASSPFLVSCFISHPSPSILIQSNEDESLAPENETSVTHTVTNIAPFHMDRISTPVLSSELITSVQEYFENQPGNVVTKMSNLSKFLDVPEYFSSSIFEACYGEEKQGPCSQFVSFLQVNAKYFVNTTTTERVFHILSKCNSNYLVPGDFEPMILHYLSINQSLAFFRQEEYHQLYNSFITAITASLFYSAGAWRTKKMSLRQFNKLDLLHLLDLLDQGEDISYIDHFCYDQFYVFYVKFVNLDVDKDEHLSLEEFLDYEEGRILRRVGTRLFELNLLNGEKMNFWDWVVFMLADIDKTTPVAMEYWYPVINLSDNGVLSVSDLSKLYADNLMLLITCDLRIGEIVHWSDIRTQLIDLMGAETWSLMKMKKLASDKLAPLLDACLDIIKFYENDEKEVSTQSGISPTLSYVARAMYEM